jgi:hypothetical protein
MPFIKPTREKPEDYLRDVAQPMLIPCTTVHDEIDYLVDNFLLEPIMKQVAEISSVKAMIDKLGFPFINFLYDIEYGKHGCWAPNFKFNDFLYPKTREEAKARKLWKKELEKVKSEGESQDSSSNQEAPKIVKIEYAESEINESVMEKLLLCDPGNDVFVINLMNGKQAVMAGINLSGWVK